MKYGMHGCYHHAASSAKENNGKLQRMGFYNQCHTARSITENYCEQALKPAEFLL
jgi:hypothetical protein